MAGCQARVFCNLKDQNLSPNQQLFEGATGRTEPNQDGKHVGPRRVVHLHISLRID